MILCPHCQFLLELQVTEDVGVVHFSSQQPRSSRQSLQSPWLPRDGYSKSTTTGCIRYCWILKASNDWNSKCRRLAERTISPFQVQQDIRPSTIGTIGLLTYLWHDRLTKADHLDTWFCCKRPGLVYSRGSTWLWTSEGFVDFVSGFSLHDMTLLNWN